MLRVIDIIEKREAVHPLVHADSILQMFESEPLLSIIAVAQDDRPIGLVERHAFLARMNDGQTRQLFGKRAITNLMSRAPLTVDAEADLNQLTAIILEERPSALAEGFVAVDEDFTYVGVGLGGSLLQALARGGHDLRRALQDAETGRERALAQAAEASAARSRFMTLIGHEIRTPLNGILGLIETLVRTDLNPQQFGMASAIRDSSEQLFRVLGDITDGAELGRDNMRFEEVDFSLAALIAETEMIWRPQAERKGLTFAIHAAIEGPDRVRADVVRVRQVIASLLGNSIKFTQEGSLAVDFAVGADMRLKFTVLDTGPGACPNRRSEWEGAHEMDDAAAGRRGGLGLTIARLIVDKMSGAIDCECAAAGGNRFWFELPLAQASAPSRPAAMVEARDRPLRGIRVLAAEDNRANRLVLTTMLDAFGCEYVLVENGAEAAKMAAVEEFDIILMDVQMPVLDGRRAATLIRQGGGPNRDVPIIALTARAGEEERRECLAAGMSEHWEKPLRPDSVLAHLQASLAAHAAGKAIALGAAA